MIRLRKWKLNRRALGLVAGALACVLLGAALRLAYEAYWSRQTADAPESDVESLATVVTDMLGPGASVDEPPPAFSWPVEGTLVGAFGWHRDLLSGEWRYRDGVRIQAPPSSTVRASAAGTVDAVNAVPVRRRTPFRQQAAGMRSGSNIRTTLKHVTARLRRWRSPPAFACQPALHWANYRRSRAAPCWISS